MVVLGITYTSDSTAPPAKKPIEPTKDLGPHGPHYADTTPSQPVQTQSQTLGTKSPIRTQSQSSQPATQTLRITTTPSQPVQQIGGKTVDASGKTSGGYEVITTTKEVTGKHGEPITQTTQQWKVPVPLGGHVNYVYVPVGAKSDVIKAARRAEWTRMGKEYGISVYAYPDRPHPTTPGGSTQVLVKEQTGEHSYALYYTSVPKTLAGVSISPGIQQKLLSGTQTIGGGQIGTHTITPTTTIYKIGGMPVSPGFYAKYVAATTPISQQKKTASFATGITGVTATDTIAEAQTPRDSYWQQIAFTKPIASYLIETPAYQVAKAGWIGSPFAGFPLLFPTGETSIAVPSKELPNYLAWRSETYKTLALPWPIASAKGIQTVLQGQSGSSLSLKEQVYLGMKSGLMLSSPAWGYGYLEARHLQTTATTELDVRATATKEIKISTEKISSATTYEEQQKILLQEETRLTGLGIDWSVKTNEKGEQQIVMGEKVFSGIMAPVGVQEFFHIKETKGTGTAIGYVALSETAKFGGAFLLGLPIGAAAGTLTGGAAIKLATKTKVIGGVLTASYIGLSGHRTGTYFQVMSKQPTLSLQTLATGTWKPTKEYWQGFTWGATEAGTRMAGFGLGFGLGYSLTIKDKPQAEMMPKKAEQSVASYSQRYPEERAVYVETDRGLKAIQATGEIHPNIRISWQVKTWYGTKTVTQTFPADIYTLPTKEGYPPAAFGYIRSPQGDLPISIFTTATGKTSMAFGKEWLSSESVGFILTKQGNIMVPQVKDLSYVSELGNYKFTGLIGTKTVSMGPPSEIGLSPEVLKAPTSVLEKTRFFANIKVAGYNIEMPFKEGQAIPYPSQVPSYKDMVKLVTMGPTKTFVPPPGGIVTGGPTGLPPSMSGGGGGTVTLLSAGTQTTQILATVSSAIASLTTPTQAQAGVSSAAILAGISMASMAGASTQLMTPTMQQQQPSTTQLMQPTTVTQLPTQMAPPTTATLPVTTTVPVTETLTIPTSIVAPLSKMQMPMLPFFSFEIPISGLLAGPTQKRKKWKRKYQYVPSFTAALFEIRGPRPRRGKSLQKTFTGSEMRPVPKGWTWEHLKPGRPSYAGIKGTGLGKFVSTMGRLPTEMRKTRITPARLRRLTEW